MRRTNGQKTQMIKTIVECPATLRFGVVQDRLRYLSEKDALRRNRPFSEWTQAKGFAPNIATGRMMPLFLEFTVESELAVVFRPADNSLQSFAALSISSRRVFVREAEWDSWCSDLRVQTRPLGEPLGPNAARICS
jgi:hypothetical protein